jgi:RNA 2',3'-cyclic 3'-phosphodiesterase
MNSTGTLRLFIAIPIPETVRAELRRLQLELQPLLPPQTVRWTRPEQFHLTLKFLGNVPATRTDALSETIRAVCATTPPMRLRAEDTGFFPNHSSPRVFWVDIKNADGLLMEFQQRLEAAVEPFAEKPEPKKFTAHVTLARFEQLRHHDIEKLNTHLLVHKTYKTFGEWTVTEVELIKSSLQQGGAIHAILGSFRTKNV